MESTFAQSQGPFWDSETDFRGYLLGLQQCGSALSWREEGEVSWSMTGDERSMPEVLDPSLLEHCFKIDQELLRQGHLPSSRPPCTSEYTGGNCLCYTVMGIPGTRNVSVELTTKHLGPLQLPPKPLPMTEAVTGE